MSDPRKPIDNGRSWKAEFLPGSPGEKAIESLGLRPDHLRHDLVAFDEQIESLAAEITRLRLRLAAWKAEAEAWRQLYDMRPDDDENFETFSARRDIARIKVAKARASTDAIEKEEANGN